MTDIVEERDIMMDVLARRNVELRAENERLRAALTEAQDLLSDGPGGPRRITAMEVIRRVLEPKP